jgi:hypothetical protein
MVHHIHVLVSLDCPFISLYNPIFYTSNIRVKGSAMIGNVENNYVEMYLERCLEDTN